jgi:hypothetical protein
MKKTKILALCLGIAGVTIILLIINRQSDALKRSSPDEGQWSINKAQGSPQGKAFSTKIQGLANMPVIVTNLPEHIQTILSQSQYDLDWNEARNLTPADKNILLQLYRQEPSILKKRALTMALGFVGDEEVVDVFKHSLSDQYAGRKLIVGKGLGQNEEIVMHRTVEALGFLANKSDSAYELLKQGMEPKFWKDYCKFTPATGPSFYGYLTSRSIQAIGWSGRPSVPNILESLKPMPLVNNLDNSIMQDNYIGAVVDAAFYNDMISQRGLDFFKILYLNLDMRLQRLQEWNETVNGKSWDKWYSERMK